MKKLANYLMFLLVAYIVTEGVNFLGFYINFLDIVLFSAVYRLISLEQKVDKLL